jgi:hypothetical protein
MTARRSHRKRRDEDLQRVHGVKLNPFRTQSGGAIGDPPPVVIGDPPGPDPIPSDPGGGIIVVPVPPQPTPVTIERLIVKITGAAGNSGKKLKAAIYDDDGVGGKPLTRVALGEEVTITAPDLDGEIELVFTLPPYLLPGVWYIGVHTDGVVEFYGATGASISTVADYAAGGGTFGSVTIEDKKLSVRANGARHTVAPIRWDSSQTFDSSTLTFDMAA